MNIIVLCMNKPIITTITAYYKHSNNTFSLKKCIILSNARISHGTLLLTCCRLDSDKPNISALENSSYVYYRFDIKWQFLLGRIAVESRKMDLFPNVEVRNLMKLFLSLNLTFITAGYLCNSRSWHEDSSCIFWAESIVRKQIQRRFGKMCNKENSPKWSITRVSILFDIHYDFFFQNICHVYYRITSLEFVYLSDLISKAFNSEIAETYYAKGTKGGNAKGKLRNQFLNYRNDMSKVQMIQRKHREPANKNQTPTVITIEITDAMEILESEELGNFDSIMDAWKLTKDHRENMISNLGALDYFKKFPTLSSVVGNLLVCYQIYFIINRILYRIFF